MGGCVVVAMVPDELWVVVEPLIPAVRIRPQGGGRSPLSLSRFSDCSGSDQAACG